ncbi:hypothetical protein niasHT_010038 [Heterodera trifolii]|uniref:Protein kinase domain-containing protein n=1 Tax=Heterodera trifolii TaxID=157864 RepID=A0ABD2M8H5_9BILA
MRRVKKYWQTLSEEAGYQEEDNEQLPTPNNNRVIAVTANSIFTVNNISENGQVSAIGASPSKKKSMRERMARFSIGGLSIFESESAIAFAMSERRNPKKQTPHGIELKMQEVPVNALGDENDETVRGEYSKCYHTFQQIGNGTFGSVKLATQKGTGLMAVSKFICKDKVLPESWIQCPKRSNKMVPIEVHLLESLNHPNIVRVLGVFENDKYYQLVMEKCGYGMDLFEFIDHQPKMDEPLISYIFRQIVNAVDYLHKKHIVHRDLKDENVIIDQNFGCKLIDFGSAAFFGEGIVFSYFYGTMEYCSPEVLSGNKYLGPEVEMWSVGILLYTLVFFENPFRSSHEIVNAEIELPWEISEGLYQVLSWLLQPGPKLRATVSEIKRHWWLTQRVDPRNYNFMEVLRNHEQPPFTSSLLNITDLNLEGSSVSNLCSNLAAISLSSAMNSDRETDANGQKKERVVQLQQQVGVVSSVG